MVNKCSAFHINENKRKLFVEWKGGGGGNQNLNPYNIKLNSSFDVTRTGS